MNFKGQLKRTPLVCPKLPCDVVLAEEGDEAVEAVVCRARVENHHLIFEILFLLDFQEPHHRHLRPAGGDVVDALAVRTRFLGEGKLRGEGICDVEGKWCVAGVLERHGVEDGHGSRALLDRCKKLARLDLVQPRLRVLVHHENLGGYVGNDELAEASTRTLLRFVHLEVLDARDLGVGDGPSEIDGAGVDGFGVACPAGACGVRGGGLEQEDVSVVPAADGGREATRGIDDGTIDHSEGLNVVVDARDWRDDGVHHGCFGRALRRNAGGGAHGGGGDNGNGSDGDDGGDSLGSSVVLKLEAVTVRLHRG